METRKLSIGSSRSLMVDLDWHTFQPHWTERLRGEGCCCFEALYVAQKERSDRAEKRFES